MVEMRTTGKETQGIHLAVTKQYFIFTYRSCDSGLLTMGDKLGSFVYELKLDNTESHIRNNYISLEQKQTPELLNCAEFRYKRIRKSFIVRPHDITHHCDIITYLLFHIIHHKYLYCIVAIVSCVIIIWLVYNYYNLQHVRL